MREVFHPGAIIREWWLDGMSANRAAERIGASLEEFESVLSGRASVTPELARKMEGAGWSKASLWLDLQADYDAAQARQCAA